MRHRRGIEPASRSWMNSDGAPPEIRGYPDNTNVFIALTRISS